jgi:pyruvate/2-oxoglutarate/acetoin dehydrogenase E1 component
MSAETMSCAKAINAAMRVALTSQPATFLAGEDIAVYGGAFGVTEGLLADFGAERVRDTPISEDAIVGMAVGAAITGMRPIIEMQFADFVVNAMDPLVNQAAKLHFMYGGNVTVPLVLRLPGGGGTGAAQQHSQSLEAWFAHVPGLKVLAASTPQDAHDLLLAAVNDPDPVVLVEHKLLYREEGPVTVRGSLAEADGGLPGTAVRREGADLTIVSYSLTARKAEEAADALAADGVDATVLDLRSLRPLDLGPVIDAVTRTGRLLVAHEAPGPVGIGAEVVAGVVGSSAFDHLLSPPVRVTGGDTPMPYAPALERANIPQVEDIVAAARRLMAEDD